MSVLVVGRKSGTRSPPGGGLPIFRSEEYRRKPSFEIPGLAPDYAARRPTTLTASTSPPAATPPAVRTSTTTNSTRPSPTPTLPSFPTPTPAPSLATAPPSPRPPIPPGGWVTITPTNPSHRPLRRRQPPSQLQADPRLRRRRRSRFRNDQEPCRPAPAAKGLWSKRPTPSSAPASGLWDWLGDAVSDPKTLASQVGDSIAAPFRGIYNFGADIVTASSTTSGRSPTPTRRSRTSCAAGGYLRRHRGRQGRLPRPGGAEPRGLGPRGEYRRRHGLTFRPWRRAFRTPWKQGCSSARLARARRERRRRATGKAPATAAGREAEQAALNGEARALEGAGQRRARMAGPKATKIPSEDGGLCLYKKGAPQTKAGGWRTGDRMLIYPDQGSVKANWQKNAGQLREAMRDGKPIFDTHIDPATGQQIPTGGFLNGERDLLESHGWRFDPRDGRVPSADRLRSERRCFRGSAVGKASESCSSGSWKPILDSRPSLLTTGTCGGRVPTCLSRFTLMPHGCHEVGVEVGQIGALFNGRERPFGVGEVARLAGMPWRQNRVFQPRDENELDAALAEMAGVLAEGGAASCQRCSGFRRFGKDSARRSVRPMRRTGR